MRFADEDNGNGRVYYRDGKRLFCAQNDGSWGRIDFKWYVCSQDGEPSHEASWPKELPAPSTETTIGREFIAWCGAFGVLPGQERTLPMLRDVKDLSARRMKDL